MVEAPPKEPRELKAPDGVLVELVSRTFQTERGRVEALAGMSLRVDAHEVVAVVGPSGCGKTTLLELICGLQAPDAGTVRTAPAALMPQRDLLLPWLSAIDNAGLALRARGVSRDEARRAAAPWLERFGLGQFERTRPAELSGGMRQRVSFLRTLLAGKPVLALDEPFAALDAITRQEMQGWLAHVLVSEPRTVIFVTHDVEEAVMIGDRVVVMSPRPGQTVVEIEVQLPRPRRRTDAAVVELRERALAALGVERETCAPAVAGGDPGARADRHLGAVRRPQGPDLLARSCPPPHQVAKALYTDRSLLWSSFLVTAQEVLLGILVGDGRRVRTLGSDPFSPTLRRATYPLIVASQAVPVAVFAPVLAYWLGFGILPQARRGGGRVVLLDRGHDNRGPGRRRPRTPQADADFRRVAADGRSGTSRCHRRFQACSPGRRSRSRCR